MMDKSLSASLKIDAYLEELTDWRGEVVGQIRENIRVNYEKLNEEWKWHTPVWSCKGNVLGVCVFKNHIKVTFFKGAELKDLQSLFNSGLSAAVTRSIDIYEGDAVPYETLEKLIPAALSLQVNE